MSLVVTHIWVSLHGLGYNSDSTFLDSDTPLMKEVTEGSRAIILLCHRFLTQSAHSQPSKQISHFLAALWGTLARPAASSGSMICPLWEIKHRWQQGGSTSEISEADWFSQCVARAAAWLNSENECEHNQAIGTVSRTYDTGTINWLRKETKGIRNTDRAVGVESTPFSGSGGGNKDIRKEGSGSLTGDIVGLEGKMRLECREVNPGEEKHIIGQLNIDKV